MAPYPSKNRRDALRRELCALGAAPRDIAGEMRSQFGFRPREAWRHALGLTLQQAADAVNALGAQRPGEAVAADASLMGKWERWPASSSRRPTPPTLLLISAVYCCEVDELLDLQDRTAMPPHELRLLQRPPSSAPPVAAPVEDLVHQVAEESADWALQLEASNVGDLTVEQLQASTRALARDYLSPSAPVATLNRARRLRDRAFHLLEGHQPPRQAIQLYAVAGYVCTLLAWISSDLGQLQGADTHARTAWMCATMAGDDELRAWVLSTRSKIAYWSGHPHTAIQHAQHGLSYAPHGTAATLLSCQEADAWAELGAASEAQAAMARATAARDRPTPGHDEVGGLLSCPDVRRANYAAGVHLRTGHARTALHEAQAALAQPPHAYGTTAQLHVSTASARLALGEPDAALEALHPVLDLSPEHRMAPVTNRLRELAETTSRTPWRTANPAVNCLARSVPSAPPRPGTPSRQPSPAADWVPP
ncbi:XRE family transcriptional regulator [Streptomyces sp. WZ-12]|uniref:XRE family transcriptional regulator n=1 Tax=Streptomyces sp. WZ-12 TaxID=3030210 RepID=UPI0023814CDB|nr:XRE family transcriptional regulator [Streptomyces sp. WZ-12]